MATTTLKHREIHRELQRRIVDGMCPPGSRLPTRDELQVQFAASRNTVQKALEGLLRDGFISTNGKAGTFVTPNPPHLCTYGLVFPQLDHETRFFKVLRNTARAVFNSESRRLRVYESVLNQPTDPKNLRLIDDIAHHRMAGLITTWEGNEFADLYTTDYGMPRVALNQTHAESGIPSVIIDFNVFFERAVERLVAQGRRKIAYVGIGTSNVECVPLCNSLNRRGLECRRYWHLNIGPLCYTSARTATHLLMSLAPADRPDALIISDDNIVEHAQAGLMDAGVRVPEDMSVIAHCNWPEPPDAIFPITRLGFDVTAMMRTSTRLIDRMRRGLAVPAGAIKVDPLFEEELPAASSAAAERDYVTSLCP